MIYLLQTKISDRSGKVQKLSYLLKEKEKIQENPLQGRIKKREARRILKHNYADNLHFTLFLFYFIVCSSFLTFYIHNFLFVCVVIFIINIYNFFFLGLQYFI